MSRTKKHSKVEIAAKLAQASNLETQGKLQSEIAQTLGVSVMTLHRWRKLSGEPDAPSLTPTETAPFQREIGETQRIVDLQLENSRLRRLVTDLLLEKMELEEASRAHGLPRNRVKSVVR